MDLKDKQIRFIATHYGANHQLVKLSEECGELVTASSKYQLDNGDVDIFKNLVEELADVEILTAQIKFLLNIEEEVDMVKSEKLDRTIERMM